jgi:hypothetical protein
MRQQAASSSCFPSCIARNTESRNCGGTKVPGLTSSVVAHRRNGWPWFQHLQTGVGQFGAVRGVANGRLRAHILVMGQSFAGGIRERRDQQNARDDPAAAVQFLASMAPAFLIRVRARGRQTSASLLMITTRVFVGLFGATSAPILLS